MTVDEPHVHVGVAPSASRTTRVCLRFPRAWAVALPGHAPRMQACAEVWLRERGVIHDAASADKFARLAVAEYANWPFPTAAPERALVITKFLALWIFYDDVIEENDDGQAARIRDAIAGWPAQAPEGDAHLRCWWELGRACARAMSGAWVERHALRFAEWVASVRTESTAAAAFRTSGIPPTIHAHLERRRLNIGMLPNIDFLEYQLGRELPATLHDDADVVRLCALSAEVVAIVNDLFGAAKDRRQRWPNLVSCVQHETGSDLEHAVLTVVAMFDRRVQEIVEVGDRLRARVDDPSTVDAWLLGLHHVMYGFARWHAMAPRYAAIHELEDGRLLQLAIV